MSALPAISFQHPWLLILVPLCAVALLTIRRGLRSGSLAAYADPSLLRWLAPGAAAHRRQSTLWVMAASLLAAFAAAGPVLTGHEELQARRAIDLALVIDISPSMTATDPAPSRLQRARIEAQDLIDRLQGNRVALIAFSAHTYRVLPLTHDLELLRSYVDALEPGLTRYRGSNLVQALETAATTLERSPPDSRALIVVSDGETGESTAVLAAARRLAERGIPAFVLGIGSPNGAPVAGTLGYLRDEAGSLHMSRLDRETLASLALLSGGRYADMRADSADTGHLLEGVASLQAREAGKESTPGLPLYPWLLVPAVLIVLLQNRRYLSPAIVAMPLMVIIGFAGTNEADAAPWDERLAWSALQSGDYEKATALYRNIGGYRGYMGAGAAAWRSKDWAEARSAFRNAANLAKDERERALAWFNEANAAARMDDIADAVALLDRVIGLYPSHTRAARNRVLLQRLLDSDGSSEGTSVPRPSDFAPGTAAVEDAITETEEVPGNTAMENDMAQPSAGEGRLTTAAGMPDEQGSGTAAMLRFADRSSGTPLPPVTDDPREVLRHRFMIMDSSRVLLPETRPW